MPPGPNGGLTRNFIHPSQQFVRTFFKQSPQDSTGRIDRQGEGAELAHPENGNAA